MKIIDVIGVSLIAIGIGMTILNLRAVHGPSTTVQDMTIHEIAPDQAPQPKRPSGQSI